MVSKARLDLPEPESPVMTISASRGSSRSMSLRLCSRAPEMTIRSEAATHVDSTQANRCSLEAIRAPFVVCRRMRDKRRTEPSAAQFDQLVEDLAIVPVETGSVPGFWQEVETVPSPWD